jgi:hypothetical protein
MRGTTRILVLFGVTFVLVAGGIMVVVWRMTSSAVDTATRSRDPAAIASTLGDTILWTIVPIVVITAGGLIVFFVLMRRFMGADRRLLATGIPGSALVLDVRDTGVTINHVNAVLEARLQVTIPGRAPYEASAEVTLGRMSWGALQPGMTVPVKVDPANPARVAIDWAGRRGGVQLGGAAGVIATPGGNFQIPGVAGAMQASTLRSAEDVVAEGERAEGTIQAVSHTGATAGQMAPDAGLDAEKAADPMVYVAMEVQPRQGAAFAAQGIYRVPKKKLGTLAIGRRVPVAFLPGRPETATIDWSRV